MDKIYSKTSFKPFKMYANWHVLKDLLAALLLSRTNLLINEYKGRVCASNYSYYLIENITWHPARAGLLRLLSLVNFVVIACFFAC